MNYLLFAPRQFPSYKNGANAENALRHGWRVLGHTLCLSNFGAGVSVKGRRKYVHVASMLSKPLPSSIPHKRQISAFTMVYLLLYSSYRHGLPIFRLHECELSIATLTLDSANPWRNDAFFLKLALFWQPPTSSSKSPLLHAIFGVMQTQHLNSIVHWL